MHTFLVKVKMLLYVINFPESKLRSCHISKFLSVTYRVLPLPLTSTPAQPNHPTRRNILTRPHRPRLTHIRTSRQLHILQHNIIARIHLTTTNRRRTIPFRTLHIPREIHKRDIRDLHF